MTIKKIASSKLEIGMFISEETEGLETHLFKQSGFIRKTTTLEKLQQSSLETFFIDVDKGKDSIHASVAAGGKLSEPEVPLEEEYDNASIVYEEALSLVENLMQDVKLGQAVDVASVETLAEEMIGSLSRNSNALLCLSRIREKDRYLLEHSINVGMLMGIFARYLGYSGDVLHQLVTGGLLHDIGKILVPDEVLNKPGKLTDDEWKEMKRHVTYGQEILEQSEGVSKLTLSICSLHHERIDGSGYPEGLPGSHISKFGRMAAIVDVYDAVTASRVYSDGCIPQQAIKNMLAWSDSHLDNALVYDFIRCISVYPVGSLVQLDNQQLAVVVETHWRYPHSPSVRLAYDLANDQPGSGEIVNLSKGDNKVAIESVVDPAEYPVDISDYL